MGEEEETPREELYRYRNSPPINPGLICVRKAFLAGLSSGGLIHEGLIPGVRKFSARK